MRTLRSKLLRLSTLLVWSGFLSWLMISGEVYRYIGARTRWVVVFGALLLALAALAQARAVFPYKPVAGSVRLSRADFLGVLTLLTPIAIIVIIPTPMLGSEAVSRKAGYSVSAASTFAPVPDPTGEVSFSTINYASESTEYAAALGIAPGYEVTLTGFVTHPDNGRQGTFALTRFATFCCAADAVPYSVTVRGRDADYPDDIWLTVSGFLVDERGEFVLRSENVIRIKEPENPYLRE
jgi:uncharacterized repeat protein (TIGR03943 family)